MNCARAANVDGIRLRCLILRHVLKNFQRCIVPALDYVLQPVELLGSLTIRGLA